MGQLMNKWVALPEGSHCCNTRKALLCLAYLAMGTLSKRSCNSSAMRRCSEGTTCLPREPGMLEPCLKGLLQNTSPNVNSSFLPPLFGKANIAFSPQTCYKMTSFLLKYFAPRSSQTAKPAEITMFGFGLLRLHHLSLIPSSVIQDLLDTKPRWTTSSKICFLRNQCRWIYDLTKN